MSKPYLVPNAKKRQSETTLKLYLQLDFYGTTLCHISISKEIGKVPAKSE